MSGHTTAVRGAVDRYRALLRWTLGDLGGADRLLQDAIALERKMRAPPWEALTRVDRARLLLERGRPGDREEAEAELGQADAVYRGLDVPGITARGDPLRAALRGEA